MDAGQIAQSAQAARRAAAVLAAGSAALAAGGSLAETVALAAIGLLGLAVAAVTPRSVEAVLESWRPSGLGQEELVAVAAVLPTVRGWVAAAEPGDPLSARTMLWAVTRLAVWAYRTLGSVDVLVVLAPHNIQHWTMHVQAHMSRAWRHKARSVLERVSRAANPAGWAPVTPEAGRIKVPAPYTPGEEAAFGLEARMPGRSHWAARVWLVCSAFGAGLLGSEILVAGPQDLIDVGGGRIAIRVWGRNPRLVPLRGVYTEMALSAADATGGDRFITATGRNAVHSIAERLAPAGAGLSLRRARNSWLAAHLQAATPLASLRVLAGPVSAQTLNAVLEHVHRPMSPQDAVTLGMGA